MSDVEEAKAFLAKAQRREDDAAEAAIVALQKAFDAKYETRIALRVWADAIGKRKPGPDNEALILASRRDRKCRQYITNALHVGFLAKLGL